MGTDLAWTDWWPHLTKSEQLKVCKELTSKGEVREHPWHQEEKKSISNPELPAMLRMEGSYNEGMAAYPPYRPHVNWCREEMQSDQKRCTDRACTCWGHLDSRLSQHTDGYCRAPTQQRWGRPTGLPIMTPLARNSRRQCGTNSQNCNRNRTSHHLRQDQGRNRKGSHPSKAQSDHTKRDPDMAPFITIKEELY